MMLALLLVRWVVGNAVVVVADAVRATVSGSGHEQVTRGVGTVYSVGQRL
jgi:hypothetical protein